MKSVLLNRFFDIVNLFVFDKLMKKEISFIQWRFFVLNRLNMGLMELNVFFVNGNYNF